MIDIFRAHMEYNRSYGALKTTRFAEYANQPPSIYTHVCTKNCNQALNLFKSIDCMFGSLTYFSVVRVRYDLFFLYHGHFSCYSYFKTM